MSSGIIRAFSQRDMGGNKITGLATGTLTTDAVNLAQLQSYAAGIVHYVDVDVASTTNITLTAPGASIDGFAMTAGQSFLAKNQTTTTDNGVYVWNGAATAATRRTDSSTGTALYGQVVNVINGTVNGFTTWVQKTTGTITVGTSAISYGPFYVGVTYTGGNGVTVAGTVISAAVVSSGGVLSASGGLSVDPAVVAKSYSQAFGDGTATTFTITHNLGKRAVIVQCYDSATYDTVDIDVSRTTTNTVTIVTLGSTLASNAATVVVLG